MNKAVKRNKQKVWRKTYGKPFLIRKSIAIAQCAVSTAASVANLYAIASSCGAPFAKGMAIAQGLIIQSNNMANTLKVANKGFINNGKAN